MQAPAFETVFVFIRDQYQDEAVPAWAMKLILEPDDVMEMGQMRDVSKEILRKENLT